MDILKITKLAKEIIVELTSQPFDAIAICEPLEDGWRVVVDVIESKARMGDDDMLSTYELNMNAEGGIRGYKRISRHRRFEDASNAA